MQATCHLKLSSSHITKKPKGNRCNYSNSIYYLTQYIQNIIISTCSQYEKFVSEVASLFFSYYVLGIQSVFDTYSTSPSSPSVALVMCQVLSDHVWLEATMGTVQTWDVIVPLRMGIPPCKDDVLINFSNHKRNTYTS